MKAYMRGIIREVFCDGLVTPVLRTRRRNHAHSVANGSVSTSLYKRANGVHLVMVSGPAKRGISMLVSDVYFCLFLDEKQHDVLAAICGCHVQWSPPQIILQVNRCSLLNKSLGFGCITFSTGLPQCLPQCLDDVCEAWYKRSECDMVWLFCIFIASKHASHYLS